MKKTLIASFFYPPEHGGIQNYTHNLASHLPAHKIAILTKNHPRSESFDKNQPFAIHRTSFDSTLKKIKLSNLAFYRTLKKTIQTENAKQLLLAHPLPLGLSAIALKKRYKIPFSIFTHGTEITKAQQNSTQKKLLKLVFSEAQNIICTTDFMRQILENEFNVKKDEITIIPPGINPKKTQPKTITSDTKLLTVGRLVKRKGHDLTLKALHHIVEENKNIHYTIAGDGPEKNSLEKLIRAYNLEKFVTIKENLTDQEIKNEYANSDIFIMPTRNIDGDIEGFGMVFLEAALYHLPIIASKSGGVSEAIQHNHNGILIPEPRQNSSASDIETLTNAIQTYINNPELRITHGNNGYNRVIQKFTWEAQANILKKIL